LAEGPLCAQCVTACACTANGALASGATVSCAVETPTLVGGEYKYDVAKITVELKCKTGGVVFADDADITCGVNGLLGTPAVSGDVVECPVTNASGQLQLFSFSGVECLNIVPA
jgi:hypothetical protein